MIDHEQSHYYFWGISLASEGEEYVGKIHSRLVGTGARHTIE